MITEDQQKMITDAKWKMRERIEASAKRITSGFPNYADTDSGEWTTSTDGHWTGGHWVGELWLLTNETGQQQHLQSAERFCQLLRSRASSHTIFRGFLFYYGAVLGHQLLGNEPAREVALEGAKGLLRDFNPKAGVVPLGIEAEEASDVGDTQTNIDAAGVVSSLFCWAFDETGESAFHQAAVAHSTRHIELCIRDDASVCQSASFDPDSGALIKRFSHKGYSDNSTWARAQAWAMLTYALSAKRMPREQSFLATAVRTADWWIAHVPDDKVAFWDFDDPAIPETLKDTSSTAIAAASLLKIAELINDEAKSGIYRTHAKETVLALANRYLTPVDDKDRRPTGMLTQGCYNKHIDLATNNELIWGDYYFYEALQVLSGEINPTQV